MYRILFFVSLIVFSSCSQNTHEKNIPVVSDTAVLQKKDTVPPRIYSYNDTITLPLDTDSDSGYFKGFLPEDVKLPEAKESSALSKFLKNNLAQKDISFLNKQTLSHSVFIDPEKGIRIDSLFNDGITIISQCYSDSAQVITINGTIVRNYRDKGDESREDIWDLNERSFRHFTFKGKPYYYITAWIMGCMGGSACGIEYYLLYDVKKRVLSTFTTFRVDEHYFFGDADGNDRLDFLEIRNDGGYGAPDSINHFEVSLYSCDESGHFRQRKDQKKRAYFISGNTDEDFQVGDSMNIEKYYWPVSLK